MSPTHDFVDIGDVLNFELLKGTIKTIDSATDTCTVDVGGAVVEALLFYHCTPTSEIRTNGAISGAAKGFAVNDPVIVFKRYDNSVIKVIGHVDGIRRCTEDLLGDYYIFYKDGTTLKIAQCSWETGLTAVDTKDAVNISTTNPDNSPVTFHLKRFTHNSGDLYFIATSLLINSNPFPGWVTFAAANPTFALITNNANTEITMTTQLMDDLNSVNYNVNHGYPHTAEVGGNDVWQFPVSEGMDCEDAALGKVQALLDKGYAASTLHIETGFLEGTTTGHAWLVVQTTKGDYALDINSDAVVLNSALIVGGKSLFGRRRQIGMNWAAISPFAWLINSDNSATNLFLYILDPTLNILYPIKSIDDILGLTTADVLADTFFNLDISSYISTSVNFSDSFIYVTRPMLHPSGGGYTATVYKSIEKYHLGTNKLILDSATVFDNTPTHGDLIRSANRLTGGYYYIYHCPTGFIDTNGNIIGFDGILYDWDIYYGDGSYTHAHWRGVFGDTVEVVSMPGFYDFKLIYLYTSQWQEGGDWFGYRYIQENSAATVPSSSLYEIYYSDGYTTQGNSGLSQGVGYCPNICMNKTFDNAFYDMEIYNYGSGAGYSYYHTPFGENVDNVYTGNPYIPHFWSHIDIDSILIQSFQMRKDDDIGDNIRRIYKNSVSCLDTVDTAVGITEENLFGLAYIPSANRLS